MKRLDSLDVLRGMDLFLLVAVEEVIFRLKEPLGDGWYDTVVSWFTHKEWGGFSPWDLVMPLFIWGVVTCDL